LHTLQRRIGDGFPRDDGPVFAEGPDLHHLRNLKLPHQHRVQRAIRLHRCKLTTFFIYVHGLKIPW
jgi:hypothetical protein